MMMKQAYRNMMHELSLSPAARAAIKEAITETTARTPRVLRPLRIAAAAACLCLLLPVTALGISRLIKPVELGEQTVDEEHAAYRVVADVAQWSTENFSEALQADLNAGTLRQVFHDKEALEAYLGFTLADSPALEEAGIIENLAEDFEYGFDLRPQLAADPSARYILTATDWEGNTATADPAVLKISSHRVFWNTEVYLDAWIILDSVTQAQLEEGILGENFRPVTGWTSEFLYDDDGKILRDKNGYPLPQEKQFTSTDYTFIPTEYDMANGNVVTVITARFNEPDGQQGHREFMGYFAQDGILYTVRPYAIYDPSQDFPASDLDGRKVLLAVLDTFA